MTTLDATLAAVRVKLDEGDGDAAYTLLAAVDAALGVKRLAATNDGNGLTDAEIRGYNEALDHVRERITAALTEEKHHG